MINKVCDFCGIKEGSSGITVLQSKHGAVICSNCMVAMHANLWHFLFEYIKSEIKATLEMRKEYCYSKTSLEHNVKQIERIMEMLDTPEGKRNTARSFNFLEIIKRLDEMKNDWTENRDQKICKMDVTCKTQIPTGDDVEPDTKKEHKCDFCGKYESKVPLLFVGNKSGKVICFWCIKPIGGDNKATTGDVSLERLVPKNLVDGVIRVAGALEQIYNTGTFG